MAARACPTKVESGSVERQATTRKPGPVRRFCLRRTGSRRWLAALALAAFGWGAAAADTLRVAVMADMNGPYGATRYHDDVAGAVRRIAALGPDLVILDGDMVAGQQRPSLGEARIRAMWAAFHKTVTDPLDRAGIPVAPAPGNHDASARRGFELERQIYAAEWSARKPAVRWIDAGHYPFYYAFRVDGVLFVGLDATTSGRLADAQISWLAKILPGRGGRATVVFGHMPLWPLTQGREREVIADPRLKALFEQHGVSAYLSGHHHAFYAGAAGGVLYVANASLGGERRRIVGQDRTAPHGITLIEIADDGGLTVRPYVAPGFTTALAAETLPKAITSPLGTLGRIDLR